MAVGRKISLTALLTLTVGLFVSSRFTDAGVMLAQLGGAFGVLFLAIAFFVPSAPGNATEAAAPVVPAPRTLAQDTLNDNALLLTLPERIESAIEMSKQHSRSLGVLSLQLDCFDTLARRLGVDGALTALAEASDALKASLRSTDHARLNGRDEILVCLPLIAQRRDLDAISARLGRLVTARLAPHLSSDVGAGAPPVDVGIAMYPIAGYRGEELIESARVASRSAQAARLGRPVGIPSNHLAPKPAQIARKPARAPRRRKGVSAAAS